MSKRITLEDFIKKLHPQCASAIEFVEFNGTSNPCKIKILKNGHIIELSRASQLLQNTTGTFKEKNLNRMPSNKMTFEELSQKVKEYYDNFTLLSYDETRNIGIIQCNACKKIKTAKRSSLITPGKDKAKKVCTCSYCLSLEDAQKEIDSYFGIGEYKIIQYTDASSPLKIQHKCGMIFSKSRLDKVRIMIGCPQCEKAKSRGERDIAAALLKYNIPFSTEFTFSDLRGDTYPLRFDFAIENGKLLIEFDGEQHFQTRSRYYNDQTLIHDQLKNNYCETHQIPLLRIGYWQYKQIPQLILDFLKHNDYPINGLGSSESETLNIEDIVSTSYESTSVSQKQLNSSDV